MKIISSLLLFLNIIFFPISLAEATELKPGLYEVLVRVEIPHLTKPSHIIKKKICLTGKNAGIIFEILSDNPLSKCEYLPICTSPGNVKFQVICPGKKAGHAFGVFEVQSTRFSGAIKMNMGGKNMTLTERQTGEYVGPCEAK